jgi:hypothetical protein
LPDQVVPEPAPEQVAESKEVHEGETPEEKEVRLGRTAGRPRDEKGRLLPGKPVKDAAPDSPKLAETPPPTATPAAAALPRPASWKKEHWDSWGKIAAENPQLAQYLHQREQEFTSGVSTYKQEFERVAPLARAIQPFEQMLAQEGMKPDQWVGAVANAHRILKYGNDQERLQAGLKLIQDYRIPVAEYLQQGGQLPQMQAMQRPPGPHPNGGAYSVLRTEGPLFPSSAIHTVLQRPLSNPVAGPPPPSASDYIPPTTFLQQMTNPQNTIVQPKSVPDYFKR